MTTSAPLGETVPGLLSGARDRGTGCLQVVDRGEVRSGQVYLVDGALVAVDVDGFRPRVGHRLRSGNLVTAEAFDAVLAACDGDAHSPYLGHALVERGDLAADVLAAVHREITLSAIGAMATWVGAEGVFVPGVTTTSFTMAPVAISSVLKAVVKRRARWELLWGSIAAGSAVEVCYPVPTGGPPEAAPVGVPAEAQALLHAMNGQRTVDEVAGECGFTRFETGYLLHALVNARLAEIVVRPGAPAHVLRAHPVPEYTSVAPPPVVRPVPLPVPAPVAVTPVAPVVPVASPVPADAARAVRARALAALDRHLVAVDDVQAALGRAQQHAADLALDTPRLESAAVDVERVAHQMTQEVAAAELELSAAREALARAQLEHDRASERAGAVRRAAAELQAHHETAHADLQRVRERAAAVAAEQQRLRAEADRLAVVTTELQGHVTAADTRLREASTEGA
ncbi:DUF4388 domain-containing protein [Nocardioides rubriscoriae]|uniref:DUF4388 domain-containing protein n=1 Tax=Nocardioides rubriscoriae TaxID=642762 RepID=UPI0014795509|nr:hypothetical protein [Nocardioides rubriscoriae]